MTFSPAPKPRRKRKKAARPLKRSAIQKKKRSAKKQAAKFQREYGGAEYLAFIQSKPCCACGLLTTTGEFIEAAHTATGGTSRKADAKTLVPLCGSYGFISRATVFHSIEGCHRELHRTGIKTFEKKYGVNLKEIAAGLWAGFRKGGP